MPPKLQTVQVRIEVPRLGFIKRGADGSVDFISPLPSPFNYGSVLETLAEDGEPEDAIVLGPRMRVGEVAERPVLAVARFTDSGLRDDKLICGFDRRLVDVALLTAFFHTYARAKRAAQRIRRSNETTQYDGLEWYA